MKKENKPNFFIVGAPRCGTTSLYTYLKEISGIFMSPIKEPGYFIPNDSRGYTAEKYYALFKNAKDEKAIGEASAGYLASKETPSIIKKQIPNAKIIITLRDPCERAFSHYLNRLRTGNVSDSFDSAVEKFIENCNEPTISGFVKVGKYNENVNRYIDIFGKNQVQILIFEETIKDPYQTVKKLLDFLNVNAEIPQEIFKQHNAYATPLGSVGNFLVKNNLLNKLGKSLLPKEKREGVLRTVINKKSKKPKMSKKSRLKLMKIFYKDVKNLEKLLERELPWPTGKFSEEQK